MPEGDTVWLAAQRLHQALAGEVLTGADLRVPRLATADLTGATVTDVSPRGKHLLMRLLRADDTTWTLHSHLRMEGAWHLYLPSTRWRGGPTHEIRAILRTGTRVAVGYRLAGVDLIPTDQEATLVGHLGPDVLADDFDLAQAAANLRAHPERAISEALLDQRIVAGLGMNYVAEACFLAGVSPLARVGQVDADEVLALGARLLQSNRGRASRVTTGRPGRGASSWVHGRRTCLRCGATLRRSAIGVPPRTRTILWCPVCQGPTRE
jgi:endonuclease VIII